MLKGIKDGKVVLTETDEGKITIKEDKLLEETESIKKTPDRLKNKDEVDERKG